MSYCFYCSKIIKEKDLAFLNKKPAHQSCQIKFKKLNRLFMKNPELYDNCPYCKNFKLKVSKVCSDFKCFIKLR